MNALINAGVMITCSLGALGILFLIGEAFWGHGGDFHALAAFAALALMVMLVILNSIRLEFRSSRSPASPDVKMTIAYTLLGWLIIAAVTWGQPAAWLP